MRSWRLVAAGLSISALAVAQPAAAAKPHVLLKDEHTNQALSAGAALEISGGVAVFPNDVICASVAHPVTLLKNGAAKDKFKAPKGATALACEDAEYGFSLLVKSGEVTGGGQLVFKGKFTAKDQQQYEVCVPGSCKVLRATCVYEFKKMAGSFSLPGLVSAQGTVTAKRSPVGGEGCQPEESFTVGLQLGPTAEVFDPVRAELL